MEEMLRSIRRLLRELRARSVLSRCDGRAFFSSGKKKKKKIARRLMERPMMIQKEQSRIEKRIDPRSSLLRFSLKPTIIPRNDRFVSSGCSVSRMDWSSRVYIPLLGEDVFFFATSRCPSRAKRRIGGCARLD